MYELRPVYPNELYHHGIKNQQWGVQNGPPYPLDRSTHNKVVKSERKAAKAEYKNARQDVRNSAHQLLAARKEAAKYGSSKNERKQAIARDASAREKFYDKQYKQSLAKYRDAASRSGSKVKYNENSLKRAAFLAGNHNATGVLAQQAFGLVGAAIANRANNNSIQRWAAGKESGAKFDRFANQKKFAEGKAAAKSKYKADRALSKSERNAEKIKIDRANRLSKINEQIKNATDSRDQQFMRAVRATIRGMSDEQYSKYSSGKMSGKEFNSLLEMHDPY